MSTEERFWEKVRKTPTCWQWIGGRVGTGRHGGYGRFAITSTRADVRLVLAHRFSWELAFGPVPVGLNVLHACDNPACVNPRHLMVGTQRANMLDAVQKGRLGKAS